MAETRTTWAVLLAQFADNTAGAISAEDLRDFVASARPFVTTTAPTTAHDETLGFDVGHGWLDVTGPTLYECVDAATGAAVWVQVYPASSSTAWGAITGTLGDQTDLDSALGAKADASSLATVATTGAYADLSGTPTLGTAAAADTGDFATAAQGGLADTAVQPADDAADLGSGAASDGYVLTADGSGGAAWEAVAGGGGSPDWGDIGGTLADQTDLGTALDAKVGSTTIADVEAMTQAAYDLITPDAGTLYVITDA